MCSLVGRLVTHHAEQELTVLYLAHRLLGLCGLGCCLFLSNLALQLLYLSLHTRFR